MNRGQRAGAVQPCEVGGIAAIGLDAIARAARNQGGRNHVAGNPICDQRALQLESARPGFVATLHRPVAAETSDQPENRRTIRRQRMQRGRALP
jgi:hypothetical protein